MRNVSINAHPVRLFPILLAGLILMASCSPRSGLPEPAPAVDQQPLYPNIVIIMADDLGWNDVGFQGSEIRTPNLDRLAAEGVVLNRFYAQPTCSPTRAALMTGQSPLRLGVLAPMSKNMQNGLPLSERILPQYLQDAGYQTALLGKWHLGGSRRPYHPNNRGFDYFYGNLHGGIGYWDHVHGGGYDLQRNGETVREEGYVTDLVAEEAVRVIAERDVARPLFLMASFNAPHLPNEAPEAAIASYADIPDPRRRVHAAMVSEFDAAVGEIVAALEAEGLINNTIIWFLSDNGGLIPAPARPANLPPEQVMAQLEQRFGVRMTPRFLEFIQVNSTEGGSDNSPFRGGKGSVFEGGVRVPSLVYWRGVLEAGRNEAFVSVQDILPTLIDAAGIPHEAGPLDGRSAWPVISSAGAGAVEAPGYAVQTHQAQDIAYYRYPWKLVLIANTPARLFNLTEDPHELDDRAGAHPEQVAVLSAELAALPRGADIALPLQDVVDDPDFFGGMEDREPWAEQIRD